MTTSFDEKAKRVLIWLIGLNVGVFVLQNVLELVGYRGLMSSYFAFRTDSLARGLIWTPITYSFLHGLSNFFHLLGNVLGIFFMGRSILPVLGQKRFLQLYFGAVLAGGLLWYFSSFLSQSTSVIGASGAVFGLLAFVCALYWDREIELLLFFAIPVRLKPKYVIYALGGLTVLGYLFQELFGSGGSRVAHSAHLGGMLFGFAFYKFVYLANPYTSSNSSSSFTLAKLFNRKRKKSSNTSNFRYQVNVSNKPKDLKKEVDRILDKINSKGFGSLSADEKQILDEARDLLRKR